MQVVGAGTYNRKLANEFREAVAPYTTNVITTVEFGKVRQMIGELMPDIVLGTQMERHTAAGFDIPCATISTPIHIEDYPLSYQPFLGYDGSNFLTDRIYLTATLGLEKHLIDMFGDAGLGERGESSLVGEEPAFQVVENFSKSEELRTKSAQLAVDGGSHFSSPAGSTATPVVTKPVEVTWSAEAQKALKQIPFFVRPKVQKRVEDYAREHGYALITLDLVYEVKERAG